MIEITHHDGVAIFRLAHGKANALDIELLDAITAKLQELKTGPARAVILTGTGRMFSPGLDLIRLSTGGAEYMRQLLPALHRSFDTLFNFPKPVIAAVNGHAVAGGCVLACCADVRIAARDDSRFGVTEILVGVPFPAMALEVMRFATKPQYFPDVILSGATCSGEEALERGLLNEIADPAELTDRAMTRARSLAALPPATFALTKSQLRQPQADLMEKNGMHIDALVEQVWTSPETLQNIRSYVAKTFRKT